MPHIKFENHMPFSPDQMLDLVADLKAYPQFVPNCSAMDVKRRPASPDQCDARMHIQFGPVAQAYTSRVTIDRQARTITAKALDGPFHHLDSQWGFTPDKGGTCVRFEVDFKMSNPLIAAVAEPAFAAKQEEIMDAFLSEAVRRYSA